MTNSPIDPSAQPDLDRPIDLTDLPAGGERSTTPPTAPEQDPEPGLPSGDPGSRPADPSRE
jgi:hypothetical protein